MQRNRPGSRERREYKERTGGLSYADVLVRHGKDVAEVIKRHVAVKPR